MKHFTIILSFIIFFSNPISATKHTHDDPNEIRYVKEEIRLNDKLQSSLRSQNAWQNFLIENPNWFTYFNEYNYKPHRAFGSPIKLNSSGSTKDKIDFFISNSLSEFNLPENLFLDNKNSNSKFKHFNYSQRFNNLDVIDSRLYIKLSLNDEIISFGLDVYSDINISVVPTISSEQAIISACNNLSFPIISSEIEDNLKVLPIPFEGKYLYKLVFLINVKTSIAEGPANYLCYVDANSGELLMRKNKVVYEAPQPSTVNIKGNVFTSHPYNPTSDQNLVDLRATNSNSNYFSDASGNFNFPANNGSANYFLEGNFAEVRTNSYVQNFNSSLNNSFVTFDNSNSTIQERTAFYAVNKIHSHLKNTFPSFTGLDISMETNVDEQGSCNAYFDGSSINFYAEGGGCHATAKIVDVVYHEYGHAINSSRYGSGMWNGGLNEGYADVWAITLTESPVLGFGWDLQDPNICVRRYDQNKKVYPQDLVGEVHADGEIIAGAFWDTYLNLGSMPQMIDLFKYTFDAAPDGPNGTEGIIYTDVLLEVLFADDNDNNLFNGTPNDNAIIQAFALHGITLLSNAVINHNPVSSYAGNLDISINANISFTYPWALSSANCFYRLNNLSSWSSVSMSSNGNNYTANIPAQDNGNIVAYYISLTDTYGNETGITPMASNILPLKDANLPYFILVGYELMDEEDFDFNIGFWQTGDQSDNATTGMWEIGGIIGSYNDPNSQTGSVQPGDQHTPGGYACAFTQNASSISDGIGANDVDGGHTTLFSPYYDLTNYTDPAFSYWRWYTNVSGANPGADWWQVLITDDGVNWVYVENTLSADLSWRKFAFRPLDYINPSASVQLKFIASDSLRIGQNLDGGSLIEAAVDDLYLYESLGNSSSVIGSDIIIEKPKLIRVTDYLGRLININNLSGTNTVIFYYDNGTVEKKILRN